MIVLLLLIAGAAPSTDGTIVDHVDIVELNTVVDSRGLIVIRQWIFWQWDRPTERHQVRAWRLAKPWHRVTRCGRCAVVNWTESRTVRRRVIGAQYRETVTDKDVEVAERLILPIELRQGLTGESGTPIE